jgi:hypothetical protein
MVISIVGDGIVGISTGPHLEIGFFPLGHMGEGHSMVDSINAILAFSGRLKIARLVPTVMSASGLGW